MSSASRSYGSWIESLFSFLLVNAALGPVVALAVYRPQIAEAYEVPQWMVSALYGSYFIAASTGGRLVAWFQDSIGMRGLLFIGAAGITVGGVVCGVTNSYLLFAFSFTMVTGLVGGMPFLSPLAGYIASRVGNRGALGLAIATVGQLTAFGIWRSAFVALETETWDAALVASSTVGALVIITLAIAFDTQSVDATPPSSGITLKTPQSLIKYAVAGYTCLGAAGTLTLISLSAYESAWPIICFSIAALIGRLLGALLFDQGMRKATSAGAAVLVLAACLVLLFWSETQLTVIIGTAMCGFGYGAFLPVALAQIRLSYPMSRTRVTSLMFYWGSVGLASASVGAGTMGADSLGDAASVAAAVALASVVLWMIFVVRADGAVGGMR